MKSQNSSMLQVITRGILADALGAFPELGSCFDRDVKTLTLQYERRGVGLLTLDLPILKSILIGGLESGFLKCSGAPFGVVSRQIQVPKLFRGLWLKIFSNTGVLRVDACVNAIYFLYQLTSVWSKRKILCSKSKIEKNIDDYKQTDEQLPAPSLRWQGVGFSSKRSFLLSFLDRLDDPVSTGKPYGLDAGRSSRINTLLLRFQAICDSFAGNLGTYCPGDFATSQAGVYEGRRSTRHGPGAVGEPGFKGEKYSFPNWSAHLRRKFPYKEMVHGIDTRTHNGLYGSSRLVAVPKTAKAPRLIAAEPIAHMFCQQLTKKFLEDKIKQSSLSNFINFRKQSLSGDLVVKASIDKRLSTVDLSSASDRLSLWAVERAFRRAPSLLDALYSHRSQKIDISGTVIPLKKFASQGAAVTFPVQTIFFTLAALAACGADSVHGVSRFRGKVRVYGDDIIIPSQFRSDLDLILSACYLKVNEEKSFTHGYFRESCGTDAYQGCNITPVKLTGLNVTTIDGRQSMLDSCNLLFRAGLWKTSDVLRWMLPTELTCSIPVNNLSLSPRRLYSFSGSDYSFLKFRWNKDLHRKEYRVRQVVTCSKPTLEGELALRAFFNERKDPTLGLNPGFPTTQGESRQRESDGWVYYPQ